MVYLGYVMIAMLVVTVTIALLIWITTKQYELIYHMLKLTFTEEIRRMIKEETASEK